MLFDLFVNVFAIAAFLLITGQLFKDYPLGNKLTPKKQAVFGVIYGSLGIILMIYTIHITSTIILDLRNIAIIISAVLGGPISSMITAIFIAIYRILFFDINNASIVAVFLALTMGIGCAGISSINASRLKKYIVMTIFTSSILIVSISSLIEDSNKIFDIMIYLIPILFFTILLCYFAMEYIISFSNNFRQMDYYRMMSDNLTDMISAHKPDGKYLYISPFPSEIFGHAKEELMLSNPYEYIHADDIENVRRIHNIVLNNDGIFNMIYRVRKKDNSFIWVETSLMRIKNKSGVIEEIICVTRDISHHKQIEKELIESNNSIKDILESIQDAFFALDKEWKFSYVNRESEKLLERSKEELIGKSIWAVFREGSKKTFYNEYNKVIKEHKPTYFEEFYEPLNKWFSVSAYPKHDGISVYFRDITQSKQMEQELNATNALFKAIFDNAGFGISLKDISGKKVLTNKTYLNMLGYCEDEIHNIVKNVHPDDYEKEAYLFKELIDGKRESYTMEKRYYNKAGNLIWTDLVATAIKDTSEKIEFLLTMINDITSRKLVEEKLKESEERLKIANEKLKRLSFIDGLTNVANRRYFDDYIKNEWNRALRNSTELSILMLDIDYFKAYNDTYGHLQGDECLKIVASTGKNTLKRPEDLFARYGGEEFAIVLPETCSKGGEFIANKIRTNIENLMIPNINSQVKPYVTVSIGVATVIPSEEMSYEEFINNADKALYKAKESGRNKVQVL